MNSIDINVYQSLYEQSGDETYTPPTPPTPGNYVTWNGNIVTWNGVPVTWESTPPPEQNFIQFSDGEVIEFSDGENIEFV